MIFLSPSIHDPEEHFRKIFPDWGDLPAASFPDMHTPSGPPKNKIELLSGFQMSLRFGLISYK
jgi:hypothetical protein